MHIINWPEQDCSPMANHHLSSSLKEKSHITKALISANEELLRTFSKHAAAVNTERRAIPSPFTKENRVLAAAANASF